MENKAQIPDLAHLQQLAEAATQGEWQVIETELPCRIGRPHVERRIFTVKDHPQLKGPYPIVNGSVALGTDESPVHHMVSITATDAEFIAAANPSVVLALITEIERLTPFQIVASAFLEKTEWVQSSAQPHEFGEHRADILRARILALESK
ncbi:ead/Ea22-like family protein [Pseudomonas simiae]|uniref:ead/Ea22-like family protein n=1 Tax=Pseudomonas simiae TaxID=321846 RepID=UPI0020955E35|nr:ead/Ea22-like family protein [Pseudomonas simiae]